SIMPLATEDTTFTRDVLGRYLCNTFDEARASDFERFDVIVLGGGSFGGAIAEQLFERGAATNLRVLVLEGGPFLLPEHVQNLPPLQAKLASPAATTLFDLREMWKGLNPGKPVPAWLDRNALEPGVEVWGLPWHARAVAPANPQKDSRFPGLAYCVGG